MTIAAMRKPAIRHLIRLGIKLSITAILFLILSVALYGWKIAMPHSLGVGPLGAAVVAFYYLYKSKCGYYSVLGSVIMYAFVFSFSMLLNLNLFGS